jgi:hypothetical protein
MGRQLGEFTGSLLDQRIVLLFGGEFSFFAVHRIVDRFLVALQFDWKCCLSFEGE